jgi:hypothetical protein
MQAPQPAAPQELPPPPGLEDMAMDTAEMALARQQQMMGAGDLRDVNRAAQVAYQMARVQGGQPSEIKRFERA